MGFVFAALLLGFRGCLSLCRSLETLAQTHKQTQPDTHAFLAEDTVLLVIREYLLTWQAFKAAAHTTYGTGKQTNTVEGGRERELPCLEVDSVIASRKENVGLDIIIMLSLSQQWTAAQVKLIKCDGWPSPQLVQFRYTFIHTRLIHPQSVNSYMPKLNFSHALICKEETSVVCYWYHEKVSAAFCLKIVLRCFFLSPLFQTKLCVILQWPTPHFLWTSLPPPPPPTAPSLSSVPDGAAHHC